jgi:hypothetical protein
MSLSQLQVQHLRSLNDSAVTCALARIESLEKGAADQELRERTQNINTEQRFHELQARVATVSSEALQYKKQIENFETQVSSLVAKEKELLVRHNDASIAAAREASRAKRLEQQVDELHRDKVNTRVTSAGIVSVLLYSSCVLHADTFSQRPNLLLRRNGVSSS